jgi:hypothetical protein
MSYVHCAGCRCAFDAAACTRCPKCGQRLGGGATAPASPASVEDTVADAAAQLARALARATPAELDALVARIATSLSPAAATPAPIATAEGSGPNPAPAQRWAEVVLSAVGGAVAEQRGTALAIIELVGALALAVGAQVAAQLATFGRARALPRLPAPDRVRRRAFALARRVAAAFA